MSDLWSPGLIFDLSLSQLDVPKAPGLGLLLERLHYSKYDRQ